MKVKSVTEQLISIASIARQASIAYAGKCDYKPLSDLFCDGFQIQVGRVKKEVAAKGQAALKNMIHSMDSEFIVRNLLF